MANSDQTRAAGAEQENGGLKIIRQALKTVSIDRIRAHIKTLEGTRHPVTAPEALEQAADYIRITMQSLGYEMAEHRFNEDDRDYRNIIATCRGTRFPEQRVILLAHYDTVSASPGADDNASGVALLLEVATILKPFQFERSIQFIAVGLEENGGEGGHELLGRRGSRALANYARENRWAIEGVVVLE
jgi:acetylornithine deacetylase/succinyl-diaminopimelate desuccinylase-like protein